MLNCQGLVPGVKERQSNPQPSPAIFQQGLAASFWLFFCCFVLHLLVLLVGLGGSYEKLKLD